MMAVPTRWVWWVLLSATLLLLLMVGSVAQRLPDEEVEALKEIAKKLKMESWDFSVNPCGNSLIWSRSAGGVTSNVSCDCTYNQSTVCHVIVVQLKRMNLTGVLPKEFSNLQFLVDIDLTLNYLSGSIPREWASIPLNHLSVMGNRISGTIPKEFGGMTSLTSLVINDNSLNGTLPEELGNLVNLTEFIASSNNFSGPLPESFGQLKNLAVFMIDGNSISGKIPDFIGNWTQLTRLDMQGTLMEGPIPSAISSLSNLNQLRISDLKGSSSTFPPLQNMTSMRILILRNCKLFGEIPQYLGYNMERLTDLDVSFNNLTGRIPDSLQGLTQVNHLYLSSNMLTGDIPPQLLKSTASVDLSSNNLSGPPQASRCQEGNVNLVGSYSSLEDSSVAACFKKNNPCSGKAKYYSLFINCGGPKVIVDDHEYEDDSLNKGSANYESFGRWAYSSTGNYMDATNSFIATNTSALNTSNSELYMTARLNPLSLKYYGLCLQNGNYSVKLHFSEIMLTSDQTYGSVGKRIFDVSIQGEKVLQDFNIADEAGGSNKPLIYNFTTNVTAHTLEIQFYWAGKGTTSAPNRGVYGPLISAISVTPNFKPHVDGDGLPIAALVGIVVAACLITVAVILLILWMGGCLGRKNSLEEEIKNLELKTGYFSLKQIKAATNNFDPSNKIGEGGFGPVYKGILPDGSVIAIKQLSSLSKQGSREFVNEIGMISAVQHPNLVKLYGCSVEGSQLLLIYEYMENNNLARALFGPKEHQLKLDWATRRKISMGIAKGLVHLHDESRLKIVHRDIKAANVLLDKDLNAKISDFGLAKLNEDEHTHISTRIAGTIGYMAPEYAMRGYLTDKADVYSFGVVLLEIVSGKSNMSEQPTDDDFLNLLEMAYVLHEKDNLLHLVDPNLGTKYCKDEAQIMLKLVLLCTNRSPSIRPKMSEVVLMLEGKMPVKVLQTKVSFKSENWRFTEFSKDSQSNSVSREGAWFDSSGAFSSRDVSSIIVNTSN